MKKQIKMRSAVITVCTVLLAVIIAAGAALLPEYNMSIDLTENKSYSVEGISLDFIDSLDTDITVYMIGADGSDTTLEYYVKRLCQASDRLELEYAELTDSELLNKYGLSEGTAPYTFVLESEKRYATVNYTDMLVYSNATLGLDQISASEYAYYVNYYEYYYQVMASQGADTTELYSVLYSLMYETTPYFIGEAVLLEACEYVSLEKIPKILFTTGNGEVENQESPISVAFGTGNRVDLSKIDTLTLDDASCLIINTPTEDLSTAEMTVVMDYLKIGGRVLVITSEENLGMTNLCSVLSAYGLSSEGGIIYEGEGDEKTSVLDVEVSYNHDAMAPVAQAGLLPKIYDATPIKLFAPADGSLITSALLLSPQDGYTVAAAAEEVVGKETTRLAWFTGSSSFNGTELEESTEESNMYTLLYAISWLNRSQESNVPDALPRQYDVSTLNVPSGSTIFFGVMFIAILPALVVTIGVITRYKRKKRKE